MGPTPHLEHKRAQELGDLLTLPGLGLGGVASAPFLEKQPGRNAEASEQR